MKVIAALLAGGFILFLLLEAIGLCAISAAIDETTRMLDDAQQEEYLRQWQKQ